MQTRLKVSRDLDDARDTAESRNRATVESAGSRRLCNRHCRAEPAQKKDVHPIVKSIRKISSPSSAPCKSDANLMQIVDRSSFRDSIVCFASQMRVMHGLLSYVPSYYELCI